MNDPRLDPMTRDALDRFTVPSLSAGFADRVVAAAAAPQPPPARQLPRRDRRGDWVRGHRVIVGVVALGLMSAAAAATGLLGDVARNVPMIGTLIASVAPAPPEHRIKKAALAKPPLADAVVPLTPVFADVPPIEVGPVLPAPREVRREIVAQRIVDRIERRAERREELGLPSHAPRPFQIAPVLRRVPPVERAAIIERVREIRQEQRAANPIVPDSSLAMPERVQPVVPPPDLATGPAIDLPAPTLPERPAGELLRSPERLEQLRRLRAMRELQQRRAEMRRQRQQQ